VAAETFFARWSRRKSEACQEAGREAVALAPPPPEDVPPPTLEQVAALGASDDFTPFVARGVDETVRRAAMKKLFSDPHFNVMDGLDVYIDDYNKFEPMTPAMVAALNHAKDLLNPLAAIAREQEASKGTLPPAVPALAADEAPDAPPDEPQDEAAVADAAALAADNLQATSQEDDEHKDQSL